MSESNVERLERIKKSVSVDTGLTLEDEKWLIEQAEKAQKLKAENHQYRMKYENTGTMMDRAVLRAENRKLREALEFYAGENMWTEPTISYHEDNSYKGPPNAIEDSGDIARKALENTK